MINRPIDNRRNKCTNISSECVIWDGPDIPCLDLCYGDSIEKVVYEQAIALCNLIEQLKPQGLDFSCLLTDNSCKPKDINELLQFILNKICEVIDSIPKPFTCEDAFKCQVTFTDCSDNGQPSEEITLPLYTTNGTNNFIKYIVEKICSIYARLYGLEQQVDYINTQIEQIWEIIENLQEIATDTGIVEGSLPVCGSSPTTISDWGQLYNWLNNLATKVYSILQFLYGGCNPTITSINETCRIGDEQFIFTSSTVVQFIDKFREYFTWLCNILNSFNTSLTDINLQITNLNTKIEECGCGCPKDIFEIIPKFEYSSATDSYIINKYKLVSVVPGISPQITSLQAAYIDLDGSPQIGLSVGTSGSVDVLYNGSNATITINRCPDPSNYEGKCNEYNLSTEILLYIGVSYTIGSNSCNVNIVKRFQVKHCVCGYVENLQVDEITNLYSNEFLNN